LIGIVVDTKVSAPPLAKTTAGPSGDETFLVPEHSLKMLWERFPTAMNSVGPASVIVVKNHSHQALTSA
jgi:hypothetical protein